MMPHVIELARTVPQPWRNGGGVTRELLTWPAGSGSEWSVRVSVADIERDGPFSPFPGIERCFTVLEGEGVVLAFSDVERVLRPGSAPITFDGEAAPGCRLIQGPTRDLNLMAAARAGRARMWMAQPGDTVPARAAWWGLYTESPAILRADGGEPLPLPARSLAWGAGTATPTWRLDSENASCTAWWMSLTAHD
ncbi:HutD family protein [Ideonella sp. DXS29W]|uniref:HutD family protein n=1 Tax=Ideonella lacteola TaxID=2984193 RepID=A0ABU9BJR0_9BURK